MGKTKDGEREMITVGVYLHTSIKTGLPAEKNGRLRGFVVARPDLPGVSSGPRHPFSYRQGSIEDAVRQVIRASGALTAEVCERRIALKRSRKKNWKKEPPQPPMSGHRMWE